MDSDGFFLPMNILLNSSRPVKLKNYERVYMKIQTSWLSSVPKSAKDKLENIFHYHETSMSYTAAQGEASTKIAPLFRFQNISLINLDRKTWSFRGFFSTQKTLQLLVANELGIVDSFNLKGAKVQKVEVIPTKAVDIGFFAENAGNQLVPFFYHWDNTSRKGPLQAFRLAHPRLF